jgi:hypothetical protein
LLREIPREDVDCAVHISVHYGTAILADIETAMFTTGPVNSIAFAACLARVALVGVYNADAFKAGFVREHPGDTVEGPLVKVLVPARSLVLAFSDVLKATHDDRGNAASVCIADKRFGKTVEQVGTLVSPFMVQSTCFFGSGFGCL